MSKSILVIDTPESCIECPLKSQLYDIQYICSGNHRRMTIPASRNKPDWCPLQEIPQKYETVSMGFERGYNACIEEILDENKQV